MIKWGTHTAIVGLLSIALVISACANSKKIQPSPSNSKLPFKEAFHQANSEKMIGHFESAEKLFKKCLVIDPTSGASHFALAEIYKAQKNTSKSLEFGKNAFNIDNNNKWYAAFLADTYFEIGDYHNSAKYYEILVETHNDLNIDNQSKLAQSLIYSNQKEKAIKVLDKMELEMGSTPMTSLTKHDLYSELGKSKQADEAVEKLFLENPQTIAIGRETMDYFLQTGQYDKAILAIDYIKNIEPDNVYSFLGEAEVNLAKGKLEESFQLLTKSLPSDEIEEKRKLMILESLIGMGFDSRFPQANKVNSMLGKLMNEVYPSMVNSNRFMSLYGQYLIENNKKDSARLFFNKAVDLDPNNYQAWVNLMNASYASGEYEQLNAEAERATAIFPNQPMLYLLKGIAEYEMKAYQSAEEILSYGKQLVVDDKSLEAEFGYHLAKSAWKQNKKDMAVKMFENTFEKDPDNARFYFGYAQLLYEELNTNKAVQYAKKASNLDNTRANYAAFYANLLVELKDFETALKMMERALNADLDNPEYLERYGDILFFLNNIEKAVDIWKQTLQIKPSSRLELKIKSKSYHE